MLHKLAALASIPAFVMALNLASPTQGHASSGTLEQRGEATFRWLGLPVYDARLFTYGGQALSWQQDFSLELTYQRRLTRENLTSSTQSEMQRLGFKSPAKPVLSGCFGDVKPGDKFYALTQGPDQIRFSLNGSKRCTLRHPDIRTGFMSIFLSQNSRSPGFSRRLKND